MLGLSSPTQVSGQSPNRLKLLIIYSGFSQKRKRVQILQFCIVISVFTSATSCGGNAAPHPPQDLPSKETTAYPFRADSILLYRASTLALKSLAVSSRRLSKSFFSELEAANACSNLTRLEDKSLLSDSKLFS